MSDENKNKTSLLHVRAERSPRALKVPVLQDPFCARLLGHCSARLRRRTRANRGPLIRTVDVEPVVADPRHKFSIAHA